MTDASRRDALKAWQGRMGYTCKQAADALGIPVMTYREYLPNGRVRVPGWVPILIRYIESDHSGEIAKYP